MERDTKIGQKRQAVVHRDRLAQMQQDMELMATCVDNNGDQDEDL